jgi:hypothetical protein
MTCTRALLRALFVGFILGLSTYSRSDDEYIKVPLSYFDEQKRLLIAQPLSYGIGNSNYSEDCREREAQREIVIIGHR